MSENNNHRGKTATDSPVDHAVEVGKRFRDAAGMVREAYADALLGIADFKGGPAGATPMDWGKLAGAAINADEVAQAGKQISRAYIDAHERAALITIELRERLAVATNTDWVMSMARTQASLERDAVNTCFSLARELLT